MDKFFLDAEDALLLIVDVQERLAAVMSERQRVIDNSLHLIELSKLLNIPVIVTEQYPKGLGPTVAEIRQALPSYDPVEKITFSCCKFPGFMEELNRAGKKKVILLGMETHVCVLQTCIGLLREGYIVHAVGDAVCSRTEGDFRAGIEFMRDAGAVITGTETALFQLLEKAGTPEFKAMSKRIR